MKQLFMTKSFANANAREVDWSFQRQVLFLLVNIVCAYVVHWQWDHQHCQLNKDVMCTARCEHNVTVLLLEFLCTYLTVSFCVLLNANSNIKLLLWMMTSSLSVYLLCAVPVSSLHSHFAHSNSCSDSSAHFVIVAYRALLLLRQAH